MLDIIILHQPKILIAQNENQYSKNLFKKGLFNLDYFII